MAEHPIQIWRGQRPFMMHIEDRHTFEGVGRAVIGSLYGLYGISIEWVYRRGVVVVVIRRGVCRRGSGRGAAAHICCVRIV